MDPRFVFEIERGVTYRNPVIPKTLESRLINQFCLDYQISPMRLRLVQTLSSFINFIKQGYHAGVSYLKIILNSMKVNV